MNIAIAKQERLVALKSALMAENNYNYEVEQRFRDLLLESAPLMRDWAMSECGHKPKGGMEEWAKEKLHQPVDTCDWYHGTWQFLGFSTWSQRRPGTRSIWRPWVKF